CERMRMCPFRWDTDTKELHLVAAVPLFSNLEPEVRKLTGAKVLTIYVATAGSVDALVRRWHYSDAAAWEDVTPNGAGRARLGVADLTTAPMGTPPVGLERAESAKTVMVDLDSIADTGKSPVAVTQSAPTESPALEALKKENARYRIAQEFHRRVTQERTRETMIDRILSTVFDLLPAEGAAIWISASNELTSRTRTAGAKQEQVPRSVIDQAVMSANGVLVHNALV